MALPIQTGNGISAFHSSNVQCTLRTATTTAATVTVSEWRECVCARALMQLLVSNEFKDDWNVMHIATRHSATWRNTYQPQILPYILNIVTLTAIAYSSKRIYWHRARFAWNCWLLNAPYRILRDEHSCVLRARPQYNSGESTNTDIPDWGVG